MNPEWIQHRAQQHLTDLRRPNPATFTTGPLRRMRGALARHLRMQATRVEPLPPVGTPSA